MSDAAPTRLPRFVAWQGWRVDLPRRWDPVKLEGDASAGHALFADAVRRWQAAGTFDPSADPEGVAQLLQSITLGFVAQRALAGDADVQAHVDALEALTLR